jgi:transcriptional regulator with XRE-family HTH domain
MSRNRLRSLRKAAGLTQQQLSERTGIPKSVVQRIDSNPTAALTLHSAVKLAPALGVDVVALLPARCR